MSSKTQDVKQVADEAAADPKNLEALVKALSGGSRRERQQAASAIALVARANPKAVAPFIGELVDALTRWEALEALAILVHQDARACEKAIEGAETALFDEDSGPVRLAAMRFLCSFGATTENRSEKVWPLIDEGIQCYHGDLEFQDMLVAVTDFSSSKLSPEVKKKLAERMRFDAQNGKGALKKRASQIVENLK